MLLLKRECGEGVLKNVTKNRSLVLRLSLLVYLFVVSPDWGYCSDFEMAIPVDDSDIQIKILLVEFLDEPFEELPSNLPPYFGGRDYCQEFEEYFREQSNDLVSFTVEIVQTATHDNVWVMPHEYAYYLEPNEFLDSYIDGTAPEARERINIQTLLDVMSHYEDEIEAGNSPLGDADCIWIIHSMNLVNGWAAEASIGHAHDAFPDGFLPNPCPGFTGKHCKNDGCYDWTTTMKSICIHEFGHSLGFTHLEYGSAGYDETVTYGAYGPMRSVVLQESDFFSYHPRNLETRGWVDKIVIEESGTYNLEDIRSENRTLLEIPGTRIGGASEDERFLISYHTGLEYDSLYVSNGVAVWHDYNGKWMDMEVASGRWRCTGGTDEPMPNDGVDYLDRDYWIDETCDDESADWGPWGDYFYNEALGGTGDMFNLETCVVRSWGDENVIEFSYRTNPNTNLSTSVIRLDANTVETTLAILMSFAEDGSAAQLEIMMAPYEKILSPISDNSYDHSEGPIVIEWSDYFLTNDVTIIESVRIYYSRDGDPNRYEYVDQVPYRDFAYNWNVDCQDVSVNEEGGAVRLEFINSRNSEIGVSEVSRIHVTGESCPWEHVIWPNGNELLFVNDTYQLRWSADSSEELQSIDVDYSLDEGVTWLPLCRSQSYEVVGNESQCTFTVQEEMIGDKVLFHVDYNFAGGRTSFDESDATFTVIPVEYRFVNQSTGANVQYPGTAYAAASWENSNSGLNDLFVTLQSCSGCPPTESYSRLYLNQSSLGAILFQDETLERFSGSIPPRVESYGVAVGDFDGSGVEGFYLGHQVYPSLYLFDNGQYRNVINDGDYINQDQVTLMEKGMCPNWIDMDHDMNLDLYIGKAALGQNFRNDLICSIQDVLWAKNPESGVYEEKASEMGMLDGAMTATLSSAWADFDDDGLWEVVVGAFQGGQPIESYQERGGHEIIKNDKRYYSDHRMLPGDMPNGQVVSLEWADFDRDNDLDLLVLRNDQNSCIVYNNSGQLNSWEEIQGPEGWIASCGQVVDYNMDGYPDIIAGNEQEGQNAVLWQNVISHPTISAHSFIDVATKLSINDIGGYIEGVLASDFDRDGYPDLLLGRSSSDGRIYKNGLWPGLPDPGHRWVGFNLVPLSGCPVEGARVFLTHGQEQPLGMQQIDSGSGRGSQKPKQLIFGVGNHVGDVSVRVVWPSGRESTHFYNTETVGDFEVVHTLYEPEDFALRGSDITATVELNPFTLNVDWVFTWTTNAWTDPSMDSVTVYYDGEGSCGFSSITLNGEDCNDVEVDCVWMGKVDGVASYKHELRWIGQPCFQGCTYGYDVESAVGSTYKYSLRGQNPSIVVKVCPTSN